MLKLRHQFGRPRVVEAGWGEDPVYYFYYADVCEDPISKLHHVTFYYDYGGTSGSRGILVWSIDPTTGTPQLEYDDSGGGASGTVDANGTCLWRMEQERQAIWAFAMADLNRGRDFWRWHFSESDPRHRTVDSADNCAWFPRKPLGGGYLSWNPLKIVAIEHAEHADEASRETWEAVKVTAYGDDWSCKSKGIVLLHDKRTGTWRAIDAFSTSCGEWGDGAWGEMFIEGDSMFAEMYCGPHSARSWNSNPHAKVAINLRTRELTFFSGWTADSFKKN